MRRLLSFCLCLAVAFCAVPAFAQAPPTFLGMWGTQGTGPGQFQDPRAIAVDPSGVVWVADIGRVQAFTPEGTFLNQWSVDTYNPIGLAADGLGRVHLMAEFYNPFGTPSKVLTAYSTSGVQLSRQSVHGGGCHCNGVAGGPTVTPGGDLYWVSWTRFQPLGMPADTVAMVCGSPCWEVEPEQFRTPSGIAVDPAGFVFIPDLFSGRVQKYTTDGTFIAQWVLAAGANFPSGIAVGPNSDVYVTALLGNIVSQFTGEGALLTTWGSPGSGPGQFNGPYGVAVSSSGDIYVLDSGNSRVQKFGNPPVPTVRSSWGRVKSLYR